VWTLGLLEAVALGGVLTGWGPLALWVVVLGVVLGGTFGLGLLFLVLRAPSASVAGDLSGVAQSVGYLIAAAGPFAVGALFDWTGGWTVPLWTLAGVLVVKTLIGLGAGRDRLI
jgi:CP family cyanate transporter-like MFS transporter